METKKEPLVVSELKKLHRAKKESIKKRLREFREVGQEPDDRLFAELCFCLCTPQSKATAAWFNAINPLMACGRLYSNSKEELADFLKNTGVRFHHTKADNIVKAREQFNKEGIREMLREHADIFELRRCLVKNVKGLGMKEASHFLRNIGLGRDLAILDRHILKNLVELEVIETIPGNLTEKRYLEIEEKMKRFSEKTRIPLEELDILLWFKETGEIFK